MKLNLQVTRLQDGAKVPVHVVAAGKLDFQQTASMGWQTNWKTMDTAYFPNRVALKTEEQELLGLMSYFCDDRFLAVELVYLESQPESNANLLHQNGQEKKYQGIAKALFAYAVQEQPRGLADAFIIGAVFIGTDSVALVLGDNIFFGQSFSSLLSNVADRKNGATIFGYYVRDPREYGVVAFDENGMAVSIEEKPQNTKRNYTVP